MRASAAALAVSVALAGGALAQQTPAKPAAPGTPAAPGQAAPGAPPQPAPPSKVDLVSPEPQWAKFCAKEPANGRDACATMRDFSTSADQPPMISINLFDVAGEERRKLRFLILPIGMLLKPGFRVIIDKNEPIEGKYDMCFQNACSAEIDIGAKTVEMLKKGQNMAVVMRVPGGDLSGRELTFNIPLKDLGPAFDGKPTDPKVLEQQRQALQQQLQKKAEEQRKALEQQQGGAPARRQLLPRPLLRLPPLRRSNRAVQASRDGGRPGASDRDCAAPGFLKACVTRVTATFQLRRERPRTQYLPSSVRSKASLTCGWRTGSPDSSDMRFCSET